jgi:putative tryptophan/tyrosine transport system substrate-binding protein
VTSLARPGGNVTGLTSLQPALAAKRLDILREAIPALTNVTVLQSPYREVPTVGERYLRETEAAGHKLGLRLEAVRVETAAAIDTAFQSAVAHHADACIILPNQFWGAHGARVGELALRHRLPVMSQDPGIVEAGGLLQYGVDLVDLWRQAAGYVDKILKGARPADLPVQQPSKFELIVNLKTARALGLVIPASLLARTDRVIE